MIVVVRKGDEAVVFMELCLVMTAHRPLARALEPTTAATAARDGAREIDEGIRAGHGEPARFCLRGPSFQRMEAGHLKTNAATAHCSREVLPLH